MSLMQRRKGKTWEREVARTFRDAMPGTDPHRGQQCRDGGDAPDVVGVPGFYIECKHRAAISAEAALKQAEASCPPGQWPLAVLKRNRSEPYVAMRLSDFVDLCSEWFAGSRRSDR
jgi:Holliday junction resolvase